MSPFNEHALEMGIMELFEQQGYSYQNHLIGDYVRKVTERPDLQENEVFRYVMAG